AGSKALNPHPEEARSAVSKDEACASRWTLRGSQLRCSHLRMRTSSGLLFPLHILHVREHDARRAVAGVVEIELALRQKDEIAVEIGGDRRGFSVHELVHLFAIFARNPARELKLALLERRLDIVFGIKPRFQNVEL